MALSGFGPWLWKRLRVVVVEDRSPEATGLVADVNALNDQWTAAQKGRGDGHELLFVARSRPIRSSSRAGTSWRASTPTTPSTCRCRMGSRGCGFGRTFAPRRFSVQITGRTFPPSEGRLWPSAEITSSLWRCCWSPTYAHRSRCGFTNRVRASLAAMRGRATARCLQRRAAPPRRATVGM
jgi:hypothetical protein